MGCQCNAPPSLRPSYEDDDVSGCVVVEPSAPVEASTSSTSCDVAALPGIASHSEVEISLLISLPAMLPFPARGLEAPEATTPLPSLRCSDTWSGARVACCSAAVIVDETPWPAVAAACAVTEEAGSLLDCHGASCCCCCACCCTIRRICLC